ncbi:Pvc16 family protein [Marimonas sp. MJW-29]|uniref:Pvc16 family protein n=1 Tax=Sulfitobacter sediminis TaxID=3234186 RepID=A0ABV3RMU1_9RHOB
MSTALAIAGVTQLLRDLLNDGLVDNDVGAAIGTNVSVHARDPDRVLELADDGSLLNVFLYNVDNQGNWANQILPTRTPQGFRDRNTPLTLDLYYLVSAITSEDLHHDILLGYAMQILHEHPGFDRAEIQAGLNPSPAVAGSLPPALQALAQTGLADQIEQLVISPVYLSPEEMSKLWTSFQATYRSSMAYRVSSVIIERDVPARSALPVLTIGSDNRGAQVTPGLDIAMPRIVSLSLPDGQPSARPGDVIVLRGQRLSGTDVSVQFDNPALATPISLPPDPGGTSTAQTVTLPDVPASWAPGLYQVSLSARSAPGEPLYRSNAAAFQLAPIASLPPTSVARVVPDDLVEVALDFRPHVWPGQRVELILGGHLATAEPRTAATGSATFTFPDIPAGGYPLRLRVDGVESWLVLRELPPVGPGFEPRRPEYDPTQTLTVPA